MGIHSLSQRGLNLFFSCEIYTLLIKINKWKSNLSIIYGFKVVVLDIISLKIWLEAIVFSGLYNDNYEQLIANKLTF